VVIDEEQKGDDQAGDEQLVIPVSTTQKETPENAEAEINYLLDIQIQQDVPNIQFIELEKAVKELKQADHSTTILALIRSQVPSVVKEYLGSSLPDAFQKVLWSHTKEFKKELFEKRDYKDAVKEALEKTPPSLDLYDALTWSILPDEANMKKGDKPNTVVKKRDRRDDQDEDPLAGSNHDKKTKKEKS
ncbi:hypothetical protein Tco_0496629, partial [Tanacetum coccineum]